MRKIVKACVRAVFLVVAFFPALLAGSGRLKPVYTFFAHGFATAPGGIGDYLRGAYYRLTLKSFNVLSGQHQHTRSAEGEAFSGGQFLQIAIGSDSWIGAAAIVMVNVGSRTTVGAGSVVTKAVPNDCVAVGNPARVIRGGDSPAESGNV